MNEIKTSKIVKHRKFPSVLCEILLPKYIPQYKFNRELSSFYKNLSKLYVKFCKKVAAASSSQDQISFDVTYKITYISENALSVQREHKLQQSGKVMLCHGYDNWIDGRPAKISDFFHNKDWRTQYRERILMESAKLSSCGICTYDKAQLRTIEKCGLRGDFYLNGDGIVIPFLAPLRLNFDPTAGPGVPCFEK